MASNAEDFILRLHEVVSGPAKVAENALVQLESRLKAQREAIAGYEQQLEAAAAKLRAMGEGNANGAVNIAAFRKQQEAVAGLQQKLDDARSSMAALEGARPLAEKAADFQDARNEILLAAAAVRELEAKFELLATSGGAAEELSALTETINEHRQAVVDAQNEYVAMGGAAADAMAAGGGAGQRLAASLRELEEAAAKGVEIPAPEVTPLQRAEEAIRAEAAAVQELEAQLELLGAGGGTEAQMTALTGAINKQRQAVVEAQQAYVKLGGSASGAVSAGGGAGLRIASGMKEGAASTGELTDSLAGLSGPVGDTVTRGQQLKRVFAALRGNLGAVAFLGAAAAVVVLTVAMVAAAVAATKWAISMADTARSQALNLESLAANHKALADIANILPRVQARSGLASEEIQQLAADLAKANVSAANMETALTAMATAKAGGASSEFLAKLQAGLAATGRIPAELADQMAQFESIAKRKMLSLDAQGARLKSNVTGLFSGLKIDGFLDGLSQVVALFDTSTASGQALKAIVEVMFQPLVEAASAALPAIVRGFLKLELAVLSALVYVQKLQNALGDSTAGGTGGMRFESDIAGFNAIATSAKAAHGALTGVGDASSQMGAMVRSGVAALKATSLGEVGANMMSSLASSILGGGSAVLSAISSVVGGAVAQAKAVLDIHSPSRVMRMIGRFLPIGMAQGIDEEADTVQESMADMASPKAVVAAAPDMTFKAPASASGGGEGRTIHVEFKDCTFGEGVSEETLEPMMVSIFHRLELEPETEAA